MWLALEGPHKYAVKIPTDVSGIENKVLRTWT